VCGGAEGAGATLGCVGDGGAARGDRGDAEAARGCAGEGGAEGNEAARGCAGEGGAEGVEAARGCAVEGGAEGIEAARGSAGVGGTGRAALGGEVDEPDTGSRSRNTSSSVREAVGWRKKGNPTHRKRHGEK
jgi:hypothetical protein